MLRMHRGSVFLTFGTIVGLLVGAPRSADGQTQARVVHIPDAPTCPSCSVVLQPIATLGGQDGPGEIDHPPISIREDGLGRFWILPGEGDMPRVYSAKGVYVATVGRYGGGPGEFLGLASLMPLPGDSMLVVDQLASRATVVGADLKPRRTMSYPQGVDAEFALDWPRSVIIQGWIYAPAQAGLQLHRVSLVGSEPTFLRSFSPDASKWRSQGDRPGKVQAVAGRSGFWSYNTYRYRFTQWSTDGKMVADFERDAGWFPRKDKVFPGGNPKTPPDPHLLRVIPIDDQRIWTIVNGPSPNWPRAWDAVAKGSKEIRSNTIAVEYLFHAIVEEIDLKSARVLSRTRTEKYIIGAFDGGRVAAYEVDSQGVPRVVIYELVRRQ